jgi:acyl dehydratase
MPNPVTQSLRHYEDLAAGEVISLGRVKVTREMITGFAREFDPLPFHLDEAAAKASLLGGLAASGWQTGALSLRLLVDAFLSKIASAGGLGFENLKWRKPVLVDDEITGTVTVAALRRSASMPDRGIVTLDFDIRNQRNESVMTMRLANLVEVRDPSKTSADSYGEAGGGSAPGVHRDRDDTNDTDAGSDGAGFDGGGGDGGGGD